MLRKHLERAITVVVTDAAIVENRGTVVVSILRLRAVVPLEAENQKQHSKRHGSSSCPAEAVEES